MKSHEWRAGNAFEQRCLEQIDRDRFRWFTLRDYLDTVWAWVINRP